MPWNFNKILLSFVKSIMSTKHKHRVVAGNLQWHQFRKMVRLAIDSPQHKVHDAIIPNQYILWSVNFHYFILWGLADPRLSNWRQWQFVVKCKRVLGGGIAPLKTRGRDTLSPNLLHLDCPHHFSFKMPCFKFKCKNKMSVVRDGVYCS